MQTHWQCDGPCSCLPNPYFALPCLQHCASASTATSSPHLGRPSSRAHARARPARSSGCNPCRHRRRRHRCCCNSRHHCTRLVLLRHCGRQSCSRHCGRRRLCRPTGRRRRRGSGSRRCAPCRPYIRPQSPCSPCRRPPRPRRRRKRPAFKCGAQRRYTKLLRGLEAQQKMMMCARGGSTPPGQPAARFAVAAQAAMAALP